MALSEDEEFELLSLEREKAMHSKSSSNSPQTQDEEINQRPSAISDLTKNPITPQHPLGALLRTLGGAAELYQGVPASIALDLQAGKPQDILGNLSKVATGKRPAQYGDVFKGAGVPKPLASVGGLYTDIVLSPGGAELLTGLTKAGAIAAKSIPNVVKPVLKWENLVQQADKSKGALDALQESYGSAYKVALEKVKNIPTEVDFSNMPAKVLDSIKNKKDIYEVKFNENGSIDTSIDNVNKIKRAADEMITPAMRKESTKSEIGQIERFAGHISGEMRKAAKASGNPIDEAMDAYGQFKNKYNLINDRLLDKRGNAMANKLKEQTRLSADKTVKEAWKQLSKESPDIKSVMDSRKNREILKVLLKISSVPTGAELGKKVITGSF